MLGGTVPTEASLSPGSIREHRRSVEAETTWLKGLLGHVLDEHDTPVERFAFDDA
jgi:hypothetical protein